MKKKKNNKIYNDTDRQGRKRMCVGKTVILERGQVIQKGVGTRKTSEKFMGGAVLRIENERERERREGLFKT